MSAITQKLETKTQLVKKIEFIRCYLIQFEKFVGVN